MSSVELFNEQGVREALFDTGTHRIGASTHLHEDTLFVAGGLEFKHIPEGDVRAHSSRDGSHARTWPLQTPRYLHASIAISPSQLLLIGGLTAGEDTLSATSSVERIDLQKSTSQRLASLPFTTAEPIAIRLPDGRILIAGGYDEDVLRQTAILHTASEEWQSASPLPSPRAGATPLLLPGHILLIGGVDTIEMSPATSILIHDLRAAKWTEEPFEIPPNSAIAPLEDGAFLIAGGRSKEGDPIADVTLWTAILRP